MKQILCCGYIALDIVEYAGRRVRRAGGTAGNVAANLSFLGWESRAAGLIGNDRAGKVLVADLRKAGVHTEELVLAEGSGTPMVVHEIDQRGHRFFFRCPECDRRFPKFRPLSEETARALGEKLEPDVFFFDRASTAMAVLAETLRAKGTIVVFEPSTRGRDPERCARAADILKYSSERAAVVAELVGEARPPVRIVTQGGNGVHATVRGKEIVVDAFPAHVVDAGGAGDWTTAGFVWRLLSKATSPSWTTAEVRDALTMAQAIAAISCAFPGARSLTEQMTREELVRAATRLVDERVPAKQRAPSLRTPRQPAMGCSACLAATA